MEYKDLYDAWKSEKEKSELQPLPKEFYGELSRYLKKLREERRMLDEGSIRAKLMNREAENVSRMSRNLINFRYRKILGNVLKGGLLAKDVLTPEEEHMYDRLMSVTEASSRLLKDVLAGRRPHVEEKPVKRPKKIVVRFLQGIPAIVGANMKTYGPFKAEDIASLPVENARILIRKGVAVRVET
jgi:DNA replication factor GINS